MELIYAMVEKYQGISVFAGVGECPRGGHELLTDMARIPACAQVRAFVQLIPDNAPRSASL